MNLCPEFVTEAGVIVPLATAEQSPRAVAGPGPGPGRPGRLGRPGRPRRWPARIRPAFPCSPFARFLTRNIRRIDEKWIKRWSFPVGLRKTQTAAATKYKFRVFDLLYYDSERWVRDKKQKVPMFISWSKPKCCAPPSTGENLLFFYGLQISHHPHVAPDAG